MYCHCHTSSMYSRHILPSIIISSLWLFYDDDSIFIIHSSLVLSISECSECLILIMKTALLIIFSLISSLHSHDHGQCPEVESLEQTCGMYTTCDKGYDAHGCWAGDYCCLSGKCEAPGSLVGACDKHICNRGYGFDENHNWCWFGELCSDLPCSEEYVPATLHWNSKVKILEAWVEDLVDQKIARVIDQDKRNFLFI